MILLVWDTETTGLTLHPQADLALQPRIIEFAGALIDSEVGGIVEEREILINPLQPITEEISKITGITGEMLVDQPTFAAAMQQIAPLFTRARDGAMVAHNLEFDEAMLRNDMRRNLITGFDWPKIRLCTVQLYNCEWGRNPKLTELYERKMGKPLAQAHRAMSDVHALCEIVIKEKLWELCRS